MSDYCVYRHIRLDNNTPFYVGKGKGYRYKSTLRNVYWHRVVDKYNFKIEIVKDNLTEEEAFNFEQKMIKLYKSFGYCETNLCDGGRGVKGYKHTKEAIDIIKKKSLGQNNSFYGKKHTEENKKKMAKAAEGRVSPRRRPIFCITNNKTYSSICEAASELELTTGWICKVLKGELNMAKGYRFEYIGDKLCQV